MKAFILVGGLGTRFGEISKSIPKPLISIGDRPILWHIIRNFIEQGTSEIYLLCRSNNINSFQDFANQVNGVVQSKLSLPGPSLEYVKVIDTGDESTTADRVILGCSRIIQDRNEKFLVTYGDSLLDIDLSKLFDFIEKKNFRKKFSGLMGMITEDMEYPEEDEENKSILNSRVLSKLGTNPKTEGVYKALTKDYSELIRKMNKK